jgi:hypothetical protein
MGYQIKLETNIEIKIDTCNLRTLTILFLQAVCSLFEKLVTQALLLKYKELLYSGALQSDLKCDKIVQKSQSNWITIKTIFGTIHLPQIQIRVYYGGKCSQKSISRMLLGVEKRFQIPGFMKEILGMIGSLTSYRVGQKIIRMLCGFRCSLMSIWRGVQWFGSQIKLNLAPCGINEFEADGTGISTRNSGKRGSELKVVYQRNTEGKLHLVGISIGKYKEFKGWLEAFGTKLKESVEKFGKVILASDCDSMIVETARQLSEKVLIQRDLWHVFYQMKYYLWQDKVDKAIRNNIISLVYKLLLIKINFTKEHRLRLVGIIINSLKANNYIHTATYLTTCTEHFYTYETENNSNKYTAKTERSMRTINARVNVGIWSDNGVLNAMKIRLSHYYNGINVFNW